MKKKGLLISTIAMVVVLIAALTTSTYAWFTVSTTTNIDGFTVSVEAGNVMAIGLNAQGYTSYSDAASPDNFVSGTVTYTHGGDDDGVANGYWTGNQGLGASISHDIVWSTQSKAVGFSSAGALSGATYANTKFYKNDGTVENNNGSSFDLAIAANGSTTSMEAPRLAIENKKTTADTDESTNGDYVYMFLGAQPTQALMDNTNILHVVIQPQGTGTRIGMAAAIHVAYRVNGGDWEDVDVYGAANKHYNDERASTEAKIYGDITGTGKSNGLDANSLSYSTTTYQTTITGAKSVDIPLTQYTDATSSAPFDQIELIIYVAGADSDCLDSAKNGSIRIGIFFGAQEAITSNEGNN